MADERHVAARRDDQVAGRPDWPYEDRIRHARPVAEGAGLVGDGGSARGGVSDKGILDGRRPVEADERVDRLDGPLARIVQ